MRGYRWLRRSSLFQVAAFHGGLVEHQHIRRSHIGQPRQLFQTAGNGVHLVGRIAPTQYAGNLRKLFFIF